MAIMGMLAWRDVTALPLSEPALAAPRGLKSVDDGLGEWEDEVVVLGSAAAGVGGTEEDDPDPGKQETSSLGPTVSRLLQASRSLESMTER